MREKNQIDEPQAGGAQSSATAVSPHPSSPVPQPPASRFIGRWKHRLTLHFRVWPKYKETHAAIVRMKKIEVNGIRINNEGRPEIWHMTAPGECGYIFEISDEDFDVLTAISKAGARMPMYRRMVVRTPGTSEERIKKECWLKSPCSHTRMPARRESPSGAKAGILSPQECCRARR